MFSPADTIVAIATAPVRAGIGVVRISGPRAHEVARAILTVKRGLEPRHATLTRVRGGGFSPAPREQDRASPAGAPASAGPRPIDEVVATFFPGPHSYTAEDVVEISAHGSVALLRGVVRAAMDAGARLAGPGEFTLRAFLNGRLDLVQAEAVADLVDAVTPLQARVAFDQLEGTLTRAIGALDHELFELAASLEASVDFPEEGYHFIEPAQAAEILGRVERGIRDLLHTSARGRVIREGRHIAILGKPNVGKSSLFNRLVGTDRAIVAARPGTTRDMLTETIDLDGIRLGLVDTAGIRTSGDEIEQEGVSRARGAAEVADLVILMLDQSRPLEDVDEALLRETGGAPRIVVVNKIDLPPAWDAESCDGEDTLVGPADPSSPGPAHASRQNAPPGCPRRNAGPRSATPRGFRPLRPSASSGRAEPVEARCVLQTDADRLGSRAQPMKAPSASSAESADAEDAHVAPPGAETQARDRATKPRATPGSIPLSLKTGEGVGELRGAMRAALDLGEPLRDTPMVTNIRHEALLREAHGSVARAIANIDAAGESASEELVLADLHDARRAFEEVTGRRTAEDVLRQIFDRFCVGK